MVVRAQEQNDCLARGATVVVWDRREEAMGDMIAGDMMEEMGADDAKVAIDCCGRSSEKGPAFGRVLGNIRVRVAQEGDHADERVDNTPGHDLDPEQQLETPQIQL